MMKEMIVVLIVMTILLPLTIVSGCQQQAETPTVPSPTPAPTPAPGPSPTQVSGAVLYSDGFQDETSGWDTFDDEIGSAYYEDGWLHLKNYIYAEFDTTSYGRQSQSFTDFVLEVETKLVEGTDDNFHQVLCRAQPTEEANYYAFGISADGYYIIAKDVNGEVAEIVSPTRSIHILTGKDAVNLMRVECVGNNLRLSVNGHLLAEVTDSTFADGYLGLAATACSEQNGKKFSEIAFDNLVVTAP